MPSIPQQRAVASTCYGLAILVLAKTYTTRPQFYRMTEALSFHQDGWQPKTANRHQKLVREGCHETGEASRGKQTMMGFVSRHPRRMTPSNCRKCWLPA